MEPTILSALRAIRAADPDGGDREPTDTDHSAHQAWAIAAFGPHVWKCYSTTGWDDGEWI